MKIKPIEDEDIPIIANWNVELHDDEGSIPMSKEGAEQRLRDWLVSGKFEGGIFVIDGIEIGYVLFETQPPPPDQRDSTEFVYVRQFYIARDHRRRGLGTAAFKYFVEECTDEGARITLDVKATNPQGQKFWESVGFTPQHIAYQLGC